MLRAGDAGMVLLAVVEDAQVEHGGAVELHGRADHQGALLRRGQVVVAAGVEAEGQRVVLHQPGAQRQVEHPRGVQLVAIDRVDLAAAVVGALARVVAVGEEYVDVEEIAAVAVAVGMAEAVDALADVVRIVRIGEVFAVAETDGVAGPLEELAVLGDGGIGLEAGREDGAQNHSAIDRTMAG
ncbi:hypothetical protein D9M71_371040 [compost metagenome]